MAVNTIYVSGTGAVSPAGWDTPSLTAAVFRRDPLPTVTLARPDKAVPLQARLVPQAPDRAGFLTHPRLRRASTVSQHIVAAAIEALGTNLHPIQRGQLRLGIVVTTMTGCVSYSRRFYEEVLKDPSTASPMIFPETVFNAPASHLGAVLGSPCTNYTLVGDEGTFVQGLAMAAQWLEASRVDVCVVVGAEEIDWIIAEAVRNFSKRTVCCAGAGAICLTATPLEPPSARLEAITDPFPFTRNQTRLSAAARLKEALPTPEESAEPASCTIPLGTGFNATSAWRCIVACHALASGAKESVNVGILGTNQQAIGVRFVRVTQPSP